MAAVAKPLPPVAQVVFRVAPVDGAVPAAVEANNHLPDRGAEADLPAVASHLPAVGAVAPAVAVGSEAPMGGEMAEHRARVGSAEILPVRRAFRPILRSR